MTVVHWGHEAHGCVYQELKTEKWKEKVVACHEKMYVCDRHDRLRLQAFWKSTLEVVVSRERASRVNPRCRHRGCWKPVRQFCGVSVFE